MPDVFISYTHVDNEPPTFNEKLRGWITVFHDELQRRLRMRLRRDVTIWRDPVLRANEDWDDVIEPQLRETKVFLAIATPDYVRSPACAREVDFFSAYAQSHGGLKVGSLWRIIKIAKLPLDDGSEALPQFQSGRHKFYTGGVDGALEIDPQLTPEAQYAFASLIEKVALGIRDTIRALEGTEPPAQRRTVYLAETSADLDETRDALRHEIEQLGHTVLPAAPLPHTPRYSELVAAQLENADLAIHLIGRSYGTVPDDLDASIVALQYAATAGVATRRPLERITWMRAGTQPQSERQIAFLDELRREGAIEMTSLDDLREKIRATLARPPGATGPAGTVFVAESSFELNDQRERVRERLRALGHKVIPDELLRPSPEFADCTRDLIARADVSVHAIGRTYGTVPDGLDQSTCEIGYDLACARDPALPRVVWLGDDAPPRPDPRYDAFVAKVRAGSAVLGGPLIGVVDVVAAALGAKPEPVPSAPATPQPTRRSVYLVFEPIDAAAADAVGKALDANNLDVRVAPTTEADEGTFRAEIEDHLRSCDGVLIYRGEADEMWLYRKLVDLKRAYAYGRRREFDATGILYGDPKAGKTAVERGGIVFMQSYGGLDPSALDPFIVALRRSRGEAM